MDIGNLENEIQSWVAVRSFAVEDANPQRPIIDANELAEMLSRVFKKLDGCVVVPVEPTPKMIDSTWDDQDEIDDLKARLKAVHDSRIEFVEYCRKVESGDFVLVPTEPTDEMLKVANNILIAAYELRISNNQCLKRIYQAMIEVAKDLEKALKNG